jgi:hypothetical protein
MSFRFLSGRQACLPELRVYHNILRGNNLQQNEGGGLTNAPECAILYLSFWAWHGAAQKAMWRKLKRHACPLGGAGRFTYKKAPRAGRQALRSGGFCKSLWSKTFE